MGVKLAGVYAVYIFLAYFWNTHNVKQGKENIVEITTRLFLNFKLSFFFKKKKHSYEMFFDSWNKDDSSIKIDYDMTVYNSLFTHAQYI